VQVAEQIMPATQTQLGVINTAYIERLQATLRGWLPMAFRRTRCPARSADRVAVLDRRSCVPFIACWMPRQPI
jgi:IS1 family transposase